MVPLREGEIADAEVTLIHGFNIYAESAEQGESLGERHATTLLQPLLVVGSLTQLTEARCIANGIGNGRSCLAQINDLTHAASFPI
jgi:hypothetical protein